MSFVLYVQLVIHIVNEMKWTENTHWSNEHGSRCATLGGVFIIIHYCSFILLFLISFAHASSSSSSSSSSSPLINKLYYYLLPYVHIYSEIIYHNHPHTTVILMTSHSHSYAAMMLCGGRHTGSVVAFIV
jgi:hypothetical protein